MAAAAKPVVRQRRDIEWLVTWALIDNGLGAMFVDRGGKLTWHDYGGRIDLGSSRASVAAPHLQHQDAAIIVSSIEALPVEMAELLIRFGRTNARPDWCEEGVGHAEVKTNKRGQIEWHYERPGDRKSRKLEPKRIWVGETPERVEWYRARYDLWWLALQALVEPLNEVMTAHEATGPRVPRAPWTVTVFDERGRARAGMLGDDPSLRRAELADAGELELPMREQHEGNVQGQDSASSGRGHGRS
jgi:hypothetical protein